VSSAPRVKRALGTLTIAGAAALAWGSLVERHWYTLRHITVPAIRPGAHGPLRILHVSDLHLLPGQHDKTDFVRACMHAQPDLVIATGDLLGHADVIDDALRAMALPEGVPGAFVLGSNDFYGPILKNPLGYLTGPSDLPEEDPARRLDTKQLVDGMLANGWTQLDNRRAIIDTAAGPVDLIGLGDPHIRRDRPEELDWRKPEHAALRLGVVHAPYRRVLDRFSRADMDLVFAGHTHGGQVRIPGFGALVANCDLPLKAARGLTQYGSHTWLHVSAGLGHSQFAPVRFACRPEATMLDLVSAPTPGED